MSALCCGSLYANYMLYVAKQQPDIDLDSQECSLN